MFTYPIEFTYNGIQYKAMIHRVGSGPVQHHVYDFNPEIKISSTIFICKYPEKSLEFGLDPNFPGIEYEIAEAILKTCNEKGIPLCDY